MKSVVFTVIDGVTWFVLANSQWKNAHLIVFVWMFAWMKAHGY